MISERSDPLLTSYTAIGILLSLILHALSLPILFRTSAESTFNDEFIATVSFVPPQVKKEVEEPRELEKRQIVAPPDAAETIKEVKPTKFLSDKDFSAEREQVRRGDGGGKPGGSAEQSEPQKPSPPKELSMKLDQGTLIAKFSEKKEASTKTSLTPSQPFSRPSGSGAKFLGLRGTTDFLPNLPDGDITLLNAKADKYAVFVRRVATQVFAAMRANGLELLSIPDLQNAREMNFVRAVLSPKGDLIKVTIEDSSGSGRFDEVLLSAVKNGAKDKNPPKDAAAADGNYHFIFKSQSWARNEVNPKTGAHFRRMWLLLATGLE